MHLARLDVDGQTILAVVNGRMFLPFESIDAALPNDLAIFLADYGDLAAWQARLAGLPKEGWLPLDEARWLAPLSPTSRIFCVGKNYAAHVKEMALDTGASAPVAPDIFVRFPSSFVGHEGQIEYPASESSFDYEGELVLVIGKAGRYIGRDKAFHHIFGYSTANDGSLRRLQKRTSQFTLGKNVDRSGGLGPVIVPANQITDPQHLSIMTQIDGQVMQDGNTSDMIFSIPDIIVALSEVTELQPGDLILTGTPDGVGAGRKPPRFLEQGEQLTVKIRGLPALQMTAIAKNTP